MASSGCFFNPGLVLEAVFCKICSVSYRARELEVSQGPGAFDVCLQDPAQDDQYRQVSHATKGCGYEPTAKQEVRT